MADAKKDTGADLVALFSQLYRRQKHWKFGKEKRHKAPKHEEKQSNEVSKAKPVQEKDNNHSAIQMNSTTNKSDPSSEVKVPKQAGSSAVKTESDKTKTNQTEPNKSKSNKIDPNKSNKTKSKKTEPDKSESNQTERKKTGFMLKKTEDATKKTDSASGNTLEKKDAFLADSRRKADGAPSILNRGFMDSKETSSEKNPRRRKRRLSANRKLKRKQVDNNSTKAFVLDSKASVTVSKPGIINKRRETKCPIKHTIPSTKPIRTRIPVNDKPGNSKLNFPIASRIEKRTLYPVQKSWKPDDTPIYRSKSYRQSRVKKRFRDEIDGRTKLTQKVHNVTENWEDDVIDVTDNIKKTEVEKEVAKKVSPEKIKKVEVKKEEEEISAPKASHGQKLRELARCYREHMMETQASVKDINDNFVEYPESVDNMFQNWNHCSTDDIQENIECDEIYQNNTPTYPDTGIVPDQPKSFTDLQNYLNCVQNLEISNADFYLQNPEQTQQNYQQSPHDYQIQNLAEILENYTGMGLNCGSAQMWLECEVDLPERLPGEELPEMDGGVQGGCEGQFRGPWDGQTPCVDLWTEDGAGAAPGSETRTEAPRAMPDSLLEWLLTQTVAGAGAGAGAGADADAGAAVDAGSDSASDSEAEWTRGAQRNPHSTEEEVVSDCSRCGPARAQPQEIRDLAFPQDSSSDEYPTRDVGLQRPDSVDIVLSGSHRNRPDDTWVHLTNKSNDTKKKADNKTLFTDALGTNTPKDIKKAADNNIILAEKVGSDDYGGDSNANAKKSLLDALANEGKLLSSDKDGNAKNILADCDAVVSAIDNKYAHVENMYSKDENVYSNNKLASSNVENLVSPVNISSHTDNRLAIVVKQLANVENKYSDTEYAYSKFNKEEYIDNLFQAADKEVSCLDNKFSNEEHRLPYTKNILLNANKMSEDDKLLQKYMFSNVDRKINEIETKRIEHKYSNVKNIHPNTENVYSTAENKYRNVENMYQSDQNIYPNVTKFHIVDKDAKYKTNRNVVKNIELLNKKKEMSNNIAPNFNRNINFIGLNRNQTETSHQKEFARAVGTVCKQTKTGQGHLAKAFEANRNQNQNGYQKEFAKNFGEVCNQIESSYQKEAPKDSGPTCNQIEPRYQREVPKTFGAICNEIESSYQMEIPKDIEAVCNQIEISYPRQIPKDFQSLCKQIETSYPRVLPDGFGSVLDITDLSGDFVGRGRGRLHAEGWTHPCARGRGAFQ